MAGVRAWIKRRLGLPKARQEQKRPKANTVLPGKPYPEGTRRAFGFKSHQAMIYLVRYKGRKRILRIESKHSDKATARKNFILHKIFHTLFPENSLTPVGITSIKDGNEMHWGMVSEIVRNRSNDYKAYQQDFYEELKGHKLMDAQKAAAYRHQDFARKVAVSFTNKIKQTGILLDHASVNICNVKGKPVFFEIWNIKQRVAKKYIEKNVSDEKTKQTLFKLLKELSHLPRSP